MTLQTIPFSKLDTTTANPRKTFDETSILGLSQSIKTDGLLQNLVVAKPQGRKSRYKIVSGERRYRALSLLVKNGDLPKDTPVPVVIREDLSEKEAHRLATIENIQRENLPPMEEAEAVQALLQDGETIQDVAAQTGLSEKTIKRRLALCNLCEDAKSALRESRIGLAQAEALTLGSIEQQQELLEDALEGIPPARIKQWLTGQKPTLAVALFEKELYTGTFTSDLFAEDETTYFDDAEQFWNLQTEAADTLANSYREQGFDPVEVMEGYEYQKWRYRPARDDEKGGVVIQLHNSGEAGIHEGIVDTARDREAAQANAEIPSLEPKERPAYSRPLCNYMAMHKSMAVQAALLANPRKAKEIAIVQMMASPGMRDAIRMTQHPCVARFAESETPTETYTAIEAEARELWQTIGETVDDDEIICARLTPSFADPVVWYERVKKLTNPKLDRLHLLLTTLCFGQDNIDNIDNDESSLFNRVANDLDVDMRNHWTPDTEFLSKRSKDQLAEIVIDAGLEKKVSTASGSKKTDLVEAMVKAFAEARAAEKPSKDQSVAKDWLPEPMKFADRTKSYDQK